MLGRQIDGNRPLLEWASLFPLFLQEIISGGVLLRRRDPRPAAA